MHMISVGALIIAMAKYRMSSKVSQNLTFKCTKQNSRNVYNKTSQHQKVKWPLVQLSSQKNKSSKTNNKIKLN